MNVDGKMMPIKTDLEPESLFLLNSIWCNYKTVSMKCVRYQLMFLPEKRFENALVLVAVAVAKVAMIISGNIHPGRHTP